MGSRNAKNEWEIVQKGGKLVFEEFYHTYVDSLFNYGASLGVDKHLIEDAIQEIFIQLWIKKSSISIESNVKGYLFTTLRRQIFSKVGKQKEVDVRAELTDVHSVDITLLNQEDERISSVKHEISKLPNREREAIVLKYQEGMNYDEISMCMNLKNQAVYKLVSRGMKKIKSTLTMAIQ